ncbi:hypothetical protein [Puia sp.]|jgi:hypothetical protein|uniref:toxin-antitoxin system YwqK family antitoxin n=1 Tax=Puia sp. TaxID=2045100 RepID=UPI002F40847B
MIRVLFFLLLATTLTASRAFSQWKSFIISPKGDTLNCVDNDNKREGRWVIHVDELRGEPGYEEEGIYKNNRKEGLWRRYTLSGDISGVEFYKWGLKDGVCQYFGMNGTLLREESWRAINPDKEYDTLQIEDVDHLDHYKTVVVKNEGAAIKDGTWKYYDPATGMVARTETYTVGKLEHPAQQTAAASTAPKTVAKPKEVLEFEKKIGKKKVKVQDGSVY